MERVNRSGNASQQSMIQAEDVVKHYGDVHALNGISLSVDRGEVYGLLGPNGAGKTTLVRILATLVKPTSGRCLVGGIDAHQNPMAVRALIGLAGQSAAVDDLLTGRENLEIVGRLYQFSRAEARRRADDILERMSLTDAADRQVRTYSGGMRRRIDLGASLVGRPEVLMLDEPTTGLDPRTRNDLWQLIHQLVDEGTTLLLTTQYLDEADELAHRLGVIDQGKIIAEGTPDELKERLGGDRLQASPANPADMERTKAVLASVGDGEPYIDERRQLVSVPVADRIKSLLAAGQSFEDQDLALRDLSVSRPSLDDVFLAITGKKAEDSSGEGETA